MIIVCCQRTWNPHPQQKPFKEGLFSTPPDQARKMIERTCFWKTKNLIKTDKDFNNIYVYSYFPKQQDCTKHREKILKTCDFRGTSMNNLPKKLEESFESPGSGVGGLSWLTSLAFGHLPRWVAGSPSLTGDPALRCPNAVGRRVEEEIPGMLLRVLVEANIIKESYLRCRR